MGPPLANIIKACVRINQAEIDNVAKFSPEFPNERIVDENVIVDFRAGETHGTFEGRGRGEDD